MSDIDAGSEMLFQKLWTTKGARFVARARLRAMNVLSVGTVATLSVYVIALSITSLLFQKEITGLGHAVINALNISLSVGILAFSIIEISREHLVQSEAMSCCALDIGKIYDQFAIDFKTKNLTLQSLKGYLSEYSNVLDRCGLNHAEIDYLKFQAEHPGDFNLTGARGCLRQIWIRARFWAAICWLYAAAIVIPPVGVGMLCWEWSTAFFTDAFAQ